MPSGRRRRLSSMLVLVGLLVALQPAQASTAVYYSNLQPGDLADRGVAAAYEMAVERLPDKVIAPTPTIQPAPTLRPGSIEVSSESASINLVAAAHGGRVVWVSDEHERYPASNLVNGNKRDWGEWWTHEPPEFPQVVVFALAHEQIRTCS